MLYSLAVEFVAYSLLMVLVQAAMDAGDEDAGGAVPEQAGRVVDFGHICFSIVCLDDCFLGRGLVAVVVLHLS